MSYPNGPTVLYRFYDIHGTLLYVGISHSAMRWRAHTRTPWWEDAVDVELEHYTSRRAAQQAEFEAIRKEAPLYNVAGQLERPGPRPILRRPTPEEEDAGEALMEALR